MAAKCSIPEIPLPHSGNPIPLLGLGTAAYPFRPGNVKEAALKAIELGYRHFDTAALYQTEQPLGEAIGEALKAGLIKSRDELFITSKLWICDAHKELVVPALQASLRNLGLDYLDLYLIHWPMSSKPGNYELYMDKGEFMHIDFESVWIEMEECQRLGLTKNIGVSNFSCKKLQFLLDVASIPPAVNQVELNPFWQQKKLKDFCKDKGIHITGYSPLGAHNCPWGSNPVLTCKVLEEIAKSRGKSVAQVCLRWAYEQGASIVVKSFNLERMTENLGIFGWKLTDDDLLKIQQIPQKRGFSYAHLVDEVCGPYRSLAELWDGEEAA